MPFQSKNGETDTGEHLARNFRERPPGIRTLWSRSGSEIPFDAASSYGLFVGVRNFGEGPPTASTPATIPFAVDDAIDLAWTFAHDLELIHPRCIRLLLSGEPAKRESDERRSWLVEQGARLQRPTYACIYETLKQMEYDSFSRPSGLLVVSFATHGFHLDGPTGGDRLLCVDSSTVVPEQTSIPLQYVISQVSKASVTRRLILLDACREQLTEGNSRGGMLEARARSKLLYEALAKTSGMAILSATSIGGFSFDDPELKNGVFTGQLLAGLRGMAPPDGEQGFITVRSLANWADGAVKRWIADHRPDHVADSAGIGIHLGGPNPQEIPLACSSRTALELDRKQRKLLLATLSRILARGEQAIEDIYDDMAKALRETPPWPDELAALAKLDKKLQDLLDHGGEEAAENFASWWQARGAALFKNHRASVADPVGHHKAQDPCEPGAAEQEVRKADETRKRHEAEELARVQRDAEDARESAEFARTRQEAEEDARTRAEEDARRRAEAHKKTEVIRHLKGPQEAAQANAEGNAEESHRSEPELKAGEETTHNDAEPEQTGPPPTTPATSSERRTAEEALAGRSPTLPWKKLGIGAAAIATVCGVILGASILGSPSPKRQSPATDPNVPPPEPAHEPSPRSEPVAPATQPETHVNFAETKYRPALVQIPAGTFVMGSPKDEAHRSRDEVQHEVEITHRFLMMETEVTQGQYAAMMGENPSQTRTNWNMEQCNVAGVGERRPVYCVDFLDAVKYANRLSEQEGLEPCYTLEGKKPTWPNRQGCAGYRLPTETEWEYAAKGNQTFKYAGSDNIDEVAWYHSNSKGQAQPVKQKKANGWGLYDMSGNVSEWVWDWYGPYKPEDKMDQSGPLRHGSLRVSRGGSWRFVAQSLRVAIRERPEPDRRDEILGFRLSRSYP